MTGWDLKFMRAKFGKLFLARQEDMIDNAISQNGAQMMSLNERQKA